MRIGDSNVSIHGAAIKRLRRKERVAAGASIKSQFMAAGTWPSKKPLCSGCNGPNKKAALQRLF